MRRMLVVVCVLGLASVVRADDGDDAVSAAAAKIQSAWSSLSSLSNFHSKRDALSQGIIGLQRVCDLYATELNDRKDFLSRNTRAEDDAWAMASGGLRSLDTSATGGQRAALGALKERALEHLNRHKQVARDARETFLRDWSNQATTIKGAILQGELPQRLRDAYVATGYGDFVKAVRTSAEAWFEADLGYLQSSQRDRMKAAVDQVTGSFKSLLDAEVGAYEQDLQVAGARDDLSRCWVE